MADRCNFCSNDVETFGHCGWCRSCGAVRDEDGRWQEPSNLRELRNAAQAIVGGLDVAPFAIFGSAEIELMGELKNSAAQLCRLLGGGRNLIAEVRRG